MADNYYLHQGCCSNLDLYCDSSENLKHLHIGQSALEWRFLFQGYPDMGIISYPDWVIKIVNSNGVVRSQTGGIMSHYAFFMVVLNDQWRKKTRLKRSAEKSAFPNTWADIFGFEFCGETFT